MVADGGPEADAFCALSSQIDPRCPGHDLDLFCAQGDVVTCRSGYDVVFETCDAGCNDATSACRCVPMPYLEIIELRGELGTCEVELVRDGARVLGFVVTDRGIAFGRQPAQTSFGERRPWVQVIHPGHGRHHTGVWLEHGQWHAAHSGTTNPTTVNGSDVRTSQALEDGDVIENPALVVRFRLERVSD